MKRKILLIDDDKELSEELSDLLVSEGYLVQAAFDGFEGKQLIKKNVYDIILLDIKMPILDGVDLLKIIKNITFKAKIILISGKPSLEKEINKQGLLPMISGFVSKPFDIQRLLNTIKLA